MLCCIFQLDYKTDISAWKLETNEKLSQNKGYYSLTTIAWDKINTNLCIWLVLL